jgi:hypothetical protein
MLPRTIDVRANEVTEMADLSSMRRLLVTLALVIALCIAIPGGSAGAAESGSAPTDTIPVGTVITGANWQRYSRFMPAGMQAIFAGDHFWRMPLERRSRRCGLCPGTQSGGRSVQSPV